MNALRDGKLVVFAGAGVSMGEPANLPDFGMLAESIGQGTGVERLKGEPEDHFLGRLMDRGVKVHDLAVSQLTRDDQTFTKLHRDLLRLFPDGKPPRIVTTNFDLLFEEAAKQLYNPEPDVFKAPALPLGSEFDGIVHVHGALNRSRDMVITDKEFGRAYLTDGRARIFLVELFRSFSVLFVGYSHNDTVMNYLARALPIEETEHRFALTDESDSDRWRFLGIEPITYPNPDGTHKALYSGVAGLAENVQRRVLEWQQLINAIANENPSFLADEEIDLIEDALSDSTRTRFFAIAASDPEWIDLLDGRGHLTRLFGTDELSGQDRELARWLANGFALRNPSSLFRLIVQKGMRLHPELWHQLGTTVGLDKDQPVSGAVLSQWVSLLVATVPQTLPPSTASTVFYWLSEKCIENGLPNGLIDIFGALSATQLGLSRWNETLEPFLLGDHYEMNEVWEKGLKPNLDTLAEPLLVRVAETLRKQHAAIRTWGGGDSQLDPTSWHRSAIEPHEQDEYAEPVDVVIDAARDCLEHLASSHPAKSAYWCDLLIASDSPLLRRLAVHILAQRSDLSADGKINWLLAEINLHDVATQHETFRVVQSIYPAAHQNSRQNIVEAVISFRWPDENDDDKERLTAHHHFSWLNWICDAAPDCTVAREALDGVLARYPNFQPVEHPDFTHWSGGGFAGRTSPWSVQELLSKPAGAWLEDLLSFQGMDLLGPDRAGLSLNLTEAAIQDFNWGLELADTMAVKENWSSDLWPPLLRAWSNELDQDKHGEVLSRLAQPELLASHVRPVADALLTLVKDGGMPYAPSLLFQANRVGAALRDYIDQGKRLSSESDWLFQAINHPAGVLAEYWIQSLSIWRQQQDPAPNISRR